MSGPFAPVRCQIAVPVQFVDRWRDRDSPIEDVERFNAQEFKYISTECFSEEGEHIPFQIWYRVCVLLPVYSGRKPAPFLIRWGERVSLRRAGTIDYSTMTHIC